MKKIKNNSGFTLMELLVVSGIIGLIGVIVVGIFVVSMRSNVKSSNTLSLRQKGEFTLGVMEKAIRGAKEISDCNSSSITILDRDNRQTIFNCNSSQIASQSANSSVLVSDVSAIDCSSFISCTTSPQTQIPEVTISFSLTQGGSGALPFQKSTLNFQTKVVPRNY